MNNKKQGQQETEVVRKRSNGQAGPDGNSYLRTQRVELRVCPQEHDTLCELASKAGFHSLAQYVRESALSRGNVESPTTRHKAHTAVLYALNRIGNNLNQVARKVNQGQPLDDEILLVLLQVQELAQEHLQALAGEIQGTTP